MSSGCPRAPRGGRAGRRVPYRRRGGVVGVVEGYGTVDEQGRVELQGCAPLDFGRPPNVNGWTPSSPTPLHTVEATAVWRPENFQRLTIFLFPRAGTHTRT